MLINAVIPHLLFQLNAKILSKCVYRLLFTNTFHVIILRNAVNNYLKIGEIIASTFVVDMVFLAAFLFLKI